MADEVRERTLEEHIKDAFAVGAALSAVRHPLMLIAEVASGMDASAIGRSRALAEVTNIFPTGYMWKVGRDALYKDAFKATICKYLPKKIVSNGNFHKWLDRSCGVPAALIDGAISYYAVYPLLGAAADSRIIIPAATSALMTFFSGGAVGTAIETIREGRDLPYHRDRSLFSNKRWFPQEPSPKSRQDIVNRVNLAFTGAVTSLFLYTNAHQIYESIKMLFN